MSVQQHPTSRSWGHIILQPLDPRMVKIAKGGGVYSYNEPLISCLNLMLSASVHRFTSSSLRYTYSAGWKNNSNLPCLRGYAFCGLYGVTLFTFLHMSYSLINTTRDVFLSFTRDQEE